MARCANSTNSALLTEVEGLCIKCDHCCQWYHNACVSFENMSNDTQREEQEWYCGCANLDPWGFTEYALNTCSVKNLHH
jgi:hypothetical protein